MPCTFLSYFILSYNHCIKCFSLEIVLPVNPNILELSETLEVQRPMLICIEWLQQIDKLVTDSLKDLS